MKYEKGNPKPENSGRKKGTPNKTTAEIRNILQNVYENNLTRLEADLDKMSPFQRQQTLERISNKFLPNLTKNENDNTHSGEVEIIVSYKNNADDLGED